MSPIEAVRLVKSAYDDVKAAYDIFQALGKLGNPDKTTADLINEAVTELSQLIIAGNVAEMKRLVTMARLDYMTAVQLPSAVNWLAFQKSCRVALDALTIAMNEADYPEYANSLGDLYNLLLPIYLQMLIGGDQWGLPHFESGSNSLLDDIRILGKNSFELNFAMVGSNGKKTGNIPDYIKGSRLFAYVRNSSKDKCFGSDDLCYNYFRTNATVQSVQKAQAGLYHFLKDSVGLQGVEKVHYNGSLVQIDPVDSYENNWMGLNNAVWTSMQPYVSGSIDTITCPRDSGIVAVWSNNPDEGHGPGGNYQAAFLCQSWPGIPSWDVNSVSADSWAPVTVGSYRSVCDQNNNQDFVNGRTSSDPYLHCYHREDGQAIYPTKGTCSHQDYKWSDLEAAGGQKMLPDGNYLTGWDMTAYHSSAKQLTYFYCGAVGDSGSVGNAWKQGTIGSTGQAYPLSFNIFSFGDITGVLGHIQGGVATQGSVTLVSGFSLNETSKRVPVGLVAGANVKLAYGSLSGDLYYGGTKSIDPTVHLSGVYYNSSPIPFATVKDNLKTMSQTVGGYGANGHTSMEYSTLTLAGRHPTLNIFDVQSGDLVNARTVKINVPASSTVIVNVRGTSVQMSSAGIDTTGGAVNQHDLAKILWNFPDATTLKVSYLYLPGSVLAPNAAATFSWGKMAGTLIAGTLSSTTEMYNAPFRGNWLVP